MADSNIKWTRRQFLEMVGLAGGSAALYETMTALGLINVPAAWAGPPQLPQGSGIGKSVGILGGGIGGLTAAYMLTQAGYKVVIVEAQDHPGGRSVTARRGTRIVEESADHVPSSAPRPLRNRYNLARRTAKRYHRLPTTSAARSSIHLPSGLRRADTT